MKKETLTSSCAALSSKIASLEEALEAETTVEPDDGFSVRMECYAEVQELDREVIEDVLDKVIVFPDRRMEIVWRFQDEMERMRKELERTVG